jgi:hypothetical protein
MDDRHGRRRIRWWLCACGSRFPCGAYLRSRSTGRVPDGQTVTKWEGISIQPRRTW